MTSQCARLCAELLPVSHVSVSGSGWRGCVADERFERVLDLGHHAVLCPAFGCGW